MGFLLDKSLPLWYNHGVKTGLSGPDYAQKEEILFLRKKVDGNKHRGHDAPPGARNRPSCGIHAPQSGAFAPLRPTSCGDDLNVLRDPRLRANGLSKGQ
jgi:hypothetical protein